MSEYGKESYVTVCPDPEAWKWHANWSILQHYHAYLRGTIADIGCNHAALSLLAFEASECAKDLRVICVDMNAKALDVGKATAAARGRSEQMRFVCADLRQLGEHVPASTLDFAMSFHTIEHIYPEHIVGVLRQVHDALKPGAHFLVSIPYDHHYPDPCHVAFYTEVTLSALMESAGFDVIECIRDDRWEREKGLLTGVFRRRE